MLEITDQLGRKLVFEKTPQRIISLVPSQSELLVDLGLENELVGITKFCVHPKHLIKEKAIVGGTKQVHYDKIAALKPDVILGNKEENTQEMILELEKIAPVHISDIETVDDAINLIHKYGQLFDKTDRASEIVHQITERQNLFLDNVKEETSQSVAYFIWKKPWMVAGSNNFIHELLMINGFKNYFGGQTRYPEVDLKISKPETADIVMLSTEPYPFTEKHIPSIQKFFPHSKIIIVDGEMFSWYGSRLIKAFDYFKTLHQRLEK